MREAKVGSPEGSAQRVAEVAERNRITRLLDNNVSRMLDTGTYLLDQSRLWFPGDFINRETRATIEAEASSLSPSLLVLTIGNAVTESGISTYQTLISKPEGLSDKSGVDESGHARWSRGWSAEEKRHDDVFDGYLRLSRIVKPKAIDITTYNLIKNGFNPRTYDDPYRLTIFAAIQEDVTATSHRRTGILAEEEGATHLAKICSRTAGDERRHNRFYIDFGKIIADIDSNGFVAAFEEILSEPIILPAALMTVDEELNPDARSSKLFNDYDLLAEATGMLTLGDFVQSMSRHYEQWNIDGLILSQEGEQARDRLRRKIGLFARLAERKQRSVQRERKEGAILHFPWLIGGEIPLTDVPTLTA